MTTHHPDSPSHPRSSFWHDPDDLSVLTSYLSEHTYDSGFDAETGEFVVKVGDGERVPELPREMYAPVIGEGGGEDANCAVCDTLVRNREGAGWVHEVGFRERGGCMTAFPGVKKVGGRR